MGQVPVIEVISEEQAGNGADGSNSAPFVLSESHAILRYLSSEPAFGVSHHWYAGYDLQGKASIDAHLDWQHCALRPGSAPVTFGRVMGPLGGLPTRSEQSIERGERVLARALAQLEGRLDRLADGPTAHNLHSSTDEAPPSSWSGPWVAGTQYASIADVSLASEIASMQALGDFEERMREVPRVNDWFERFEAFAGEEWEGSCRLLKKVCQLARDKGIDRPKQAS